MPPLLIRFNRRRVLRSIAIGWVLGTCAAFVVAAAAETMRTPAARLLGGLGLAPALVGFLLVEGLTLAAVGYSLGHLLRRRQCLRLTQVGIEIEDSAGAYRVDWENLAEEGLHPGPLAGLRVADRDSLLATHRGTATQRELLATREPVGGYDLVFTPEELDCGLDPFLSAVRRYRQEPVARQELT